MLSTIVAAGMAMASVVNPASASSAQDVPTDRITMDVVTVNGSGCPAGTAAVATSSDNTAFTVTYSDYIAAAGEGASPTDFRKNCQLVLKVNVPQGFTYGIAQADYRGFAHLADGGSALQAAGYYIQGTSPTTRSSHDLTGPYSDNWQFTDRTEVAEIVYAPCGEERYFNVNTELRVFSGDSGSSSSFMTMDSTDGSASTEYHLSWKECN